jgi:hypothetical protein
MGDQRSREAPMAVNYRAGCLPGRRRIRNAPRRRAPRNTTMPMISRYSRPWQRRPRCPAGSPRSPAAGRGQSSDPPISRAAQRHGMPVLVLT